MRALSFTNSPLILAPMGGVGTPQLAAAVAQEGGFPFLPCAYSTPEQIRNAVDALRELTNRPFGLNLFIEEALPPLDDSSLHAAHERLRVYREELGIPHPSLPARPPEHYEAQMETVLALRPAAFSFTFGIPRDPWLRRFREAGIATVGTATSVEEARALADAGVDAVCAQGAEAGAHRGTFLGDASASLIGTMALVPAIVDAVNLPVIASGGIADGRGIAAALVLGAAAAQVGTAFLLAPEAATSRAWREALKAHSARDTVVTPAFSGRSARGIRNRFVDDFASEPPAPYPFQNAMTRDIRNAAAAAGKAAYLSLWAGQAFPLARALPAADLTRLFVQECRLALDGAQTQISSRQRGSDQ